MERDILIVIGLLMYGTLHGAAVAYISYVAPKALPLARLLTAPIGVAVAILASVPYIGWQNAGIALACLAIAALPVGLILGYIAIQSLRNDGL